MLLDDGTAVDAYDVAVGEGSADGLHGLCVEVGLGVGGHEHGSVDDEIVGVGGGQSVGLVVDGAGQWQSEQSVGLSVECAQLLQFSFHFCQVGVLVVACRIYNGVVGTDAHQCVDVSVGVVAYETAMTEPDDALGS